MVKLTKFWWIIIIGSVVLIPLILILVITRFLMNPVKSWWFFGGALIFYFVVGLITGIIFLIFKLRVKKEPKIELEPKDARAKAVYELKMDEDNPDNFIVEKQKILRVGMIGLPRTSILWLKGKGSEKNQRIDALINLGDTKGEISWLRGGTDQESKETAKGMALNPSEEIVEEKIMGIDEFGRPTTRVTTKKASQVEKKLEEEKKEAESANII
mgnify:CR=1 FL=1